MSKSDLKSAIQGLKIHSPFDLRKQGQVTLQAPQPEVPQSQEAKFQSPRPEPTPNQVTAEKRTTQSSTRPAGFFRLAHSVFGDPELRKLPGDAFRLFLWMSSQAWRFHDSDGTLRASISYMETATGVSHATISRSLTQLKDSRLVELVQTDFKKGNLWRVSNRARDGEYPEGAQNKEPQKLREPPSDQAGSSPRLRERLTQFEGEIRTINLLQAHNNSLSAEITSEDLRAYFVTLKPARKRESELNAFRTFKNDFSEEEILMCMEHLNEQGSLESGTPCHSPMAYLSKSIVQVLSKAKESRIKRMRVENRDQIQAEQENQKLAEIAREEREGMRREKAFTEAFPTPEAQSEFIDRIAGQYPFLGRSGPIMENLAISAWWSENEKRPNERPAGQESPTQSLE